MKKTRMVLGIALIAFCGALFSAETLDSLLKKNYEARGGLEKLKSVKSVKMTGKFFQPMAGMDLPAVMLQKSPNKMRMDMTFQDKKIVIGFDGQKAWMIIPFISEDAQEMPADQAKEIMEQAELENPLAVYREKGHQLELVGEEDMEGSKVYKLKLTRKDGRIWHIYLDKETGIDLKTTVYIKQGDADVMVESILGDYKPVEGLMMPFYIEGKTNGQVSMKMTIDNIELNPKLDDELFAMPAKKTAAPAAEKK